MPSLHEIIENTAATDTEAPEAFTYKDHYHGAEESFFLPNNELIVASRDGKLFFVDPETEVEYHTVEDLRKAGIEILEVRVTHEIRVREYNDK